MISPEDRMKAYCKAFGWQGGTIHQVSEETGVSVQNLLYAEAPKNPSLTSDYCLGWFAGRTCSTEHNKAVNFPKYKGNVDFWIGVAEGIADAPTYNGAK